MFWTEPSFLWFLMSASWYIYTQWTSLDKHSLLLNPANTYCSVWWFCLSQAKQLVLFGYFPGYYSYVSMLWTMASHKRKSRWNQTKLLKIAFSVFWKFSWILLTTLVSPLATLISVKLHQKFPNGPFFLQINASVLNIRVSYLISRTKIFFAAICQPKIAPSSSVL